MFDKWKFVAMLVIWMAFISFAVPDPVAASAGGYTVEENGEYNTLPISNEVTASVSGGIQSISHN